MGPWELQLGQAWEEARGACTLSTEQEKQERLSYELDIPLFGIFQKESDVADHRDASTPVFTTDFFFKMVNLRILAHMVISISIAKKKKKKKSMYNTIKYYSAIAKNELYYSQEMD